MDIIGPFTLASGGIVGIDYFPKRIEAQPTAKIIANQVREFILLNLVTRFGILMGIVMDHGVQSYCGPNERFICPFGIKFPYSYVCHPWSNGQAEVANKEILNTLKKKLDDLKGTWDDMVPSVVWSKRTTKKKTTREAPFQLAFSAEVVLWDKVGLPIKLKNPELLSRAKR